MILFPAIDLKEGACVRLLQGNFDQATVFNTSPADQAMVFANAGCRWLHVVDLDGAITGRPINAAAVNAILAAVTIPVQLGGGIRDLATIALWLEKGVKRIILGTIALYNPVLVKAACRLFPDRIAVSVDTRSSRVAVKGWTETAHHVTALELALRFEDAGVATIIHTDISRDGALTSPNVTASTTLAKQITTPVIISGGVSRLDDLRVIREAAKATPGLIGVIAGRALYDKRLNLSAALALCHKNT